MCLEKDGFTYLTRKAVILQLHSTIVNQRQINRKHSDRFQAIPNLDNGSHAGSTQDGHLPRIDAVRPVLPGVVHADDAVYDGPVDALQSHPRAAPPEGHCSGGHRPPPAETCRRDKGDGSSAAARAPSEAGGRRHPRGRAAWGGPGRRCEAHRRRSGRRPDRWGVGRRGGRPRPLPAPQRRGRRCPSERRTAGATAAATSIPLTPTPPPARRTAATSSPRAASPPPPPSRPIAIPIGCAAPPHWAAELSVRAGVPRLPWERGRGEPSGPRAGAGLQRGRPAASHGKPMGKQPPSYLTKNHLMNVNFFFKTKTAIIPKHYTKRTVSHTLTNSALLANFK